MSLLKKPLHTVHSCNGHKDIPMGTMQSASVKVHLLALHEYRSMKWSMISLFSQPAMALLQCQFIHVTYIM